MIKAYKGRDRPKDLCIENFHVRGHIFEVMVQLPVAGVSWCALIGVAPCSMALVTSLELGYGALLN